MKRSLLFVFVLAVMPMLHAQLPNRVTKLQGLWEYGEGSGYERWFLKNDIMYGESFRINKLGDTIVAERFEIQYVNKRLVLNLKAYHTKGDSVVVQERVLIGKKRKMEFSSVSSSQLRSLHFKFGFLTRNRLKLFVSHQGVEKPQKLRLIRRED